MAGALALLTRFFSPQDSIGPQPFALGRPAPRRFAAAAGEVFAPKALALVFDERGPGISVNGMFHNEEEGTLVDLVSAEVSAGGMAVEMENEGHDEEEKDERDHLRLGDVITLSGSTWLDAGRSGMFLAPIRSPEMDEAMDGVLSGLDGEAEKMVTKMDRDRPEGYSLEEESMKRPVEDFLSSYNVRALLEEMERLFIWRPGHVSMTVWFLDEEDGIIDEIPVSFRLEEEDSAALRENMRILAVNALLAALDLDQMELNSVTLDGGEGML